MSISLFLPVCLGTRKREAAAPKPRECFLWGTEEFHLFVRRASRAIKNEIVAVVPQKAERTPVPGAGFSPEAVPGNEVERDDTRNLQQTPFEIEV
jgi:hypothetical protein